MKIATFTPSWTAHRIQMWAPFPPGGPLHADDPDSEFGVLCGLGQLGYKHVQVWEAEFDPAHDRACLKCAKALKEKAS